MPDQRKHQPMLNGMIPQYREINQNKKNSITANVLLIILILHLLFVFAVYFSTKLVFQNPLLPKYIAFETFAPYALKGLIVTFGLLTAILLKFLKQNLIVIVICIIVITIFYCTPFEPDFTPYQK